MLVLINYLLSAVDVGIDKLSAFSCRLGIAKLHGVCIDKLLAISDYVNIDKLHVTITSNRWWTLVV